MTDKRMIVVNLCKNCERRYWCPGLPDWGKMKDWPKKIPNTCPLPKIPTQKLRGGVIA